MIGENSMSSLIEDEKLLRLYEVIKLTRLSVETIYRRGDNGSFPQRVRINDINVRWIASEIYDWLKRKPVQSSHDRLMLSQIDL